MLPTYKHFIPASRFFPFYAVCAVLGLSLGYSLWPGVMTWDSASVLTYLLDINFKRAHAPGLQYIWYTLLPFSKSHALLFALNTFFYWTAVALYCAALAGRRYWMGWLPVIAALLPYTIYMSHVVVFDVASNVFLLLFFALCLTLLNRPGSNTLLILSLLCLTAFLISRYNTITCLVPMAGFLAYVYKEDSGLKQILIRTIAISFIAAMINHLSIISLVEGRPDYIARFTAKYDLLAMSVEQNHQGITSNFPDELKKRVTDIYETHGWFLLLFDDNHGFVTYPKAEEEFHHLGTKEMWVSQILKDPLTYLKVRYKTASRMYTRKTLAYRQSPLFGWKAFENHRTVPLLNPYFEKELLDRDSIVRSRGELNPVAKLYGHVLSSFMTHFPGTWGIPIIGILMLLAAGVFLLKRFWCESLTTLVFMNVVALAWYLPLLVIVQIPMARYIFPSDSLIIFSIPFFAAAGSEAVRHFSRREIQSGKKTEAQAS